MKARWGFVSNSSSTSFTFLFKGDSFEDLYAMIRKYSCHFERHEEWGGDISWHANAESVIQSIKDEIIKQPKKKYHFDDIELMKTENVLKEAKDELEQYQNYKKENPDYKDSPEDWMPISNEIFRLEDAIKNGLDTACEVEFGDSHGIVGSVGCAMDHQGRNIQLECKDFIVVARSQH